jgi:hypothetical protein
MAWLLMSTGLKGFEHVEKSFILVVHYMVLPLHNTNSQKLLTRRERNFPFFIKTHKLVNIWSQNQHSKENIF